MQAVIAHNFCISKSSDVFLSLNCNPSLVVFFLVNVELLYTEKVYNLLDKMNEDS